MCSRLRSLSALWGFLSPANRSKPYDGLGPYCADLPFPASVLLSSCWAMSARVECSHPGYVRFVVPCSAYTGERTTTVTVIITFLFRLIFRLTDCASILTCVRINCPIAGVPDNYPRVQGRRYRCLFSSTSMWPNSTICRREEKGWGRSGLPITQRD